MVLLKLVARWSSSTKDWFTWFLDLEPAVSR
jgi:hypothetical protein